jgi:hypothetical protein
MKVMQDPMEFTLEARATQVIDAINSQLTLPPTRVIYLVPGDAVVWDLGNCGQLSARLSQLVPHATYPGAYSLKCAIDYWVATLEITLLRCAATVGDDMKPPTAARLTQDGNQGAEDMRIMLEQITLMDWVDAVPVWKPEGPQGGVFGTTWMITTKLDATPCA